MHLKPHESQQSSTRQPEWTVVILGLETHVVVEDF